MRGHRKDFQVPQAMGTFTRLPELREEHFDTITRDAQDGIVGLSVQGPELDWVILVGPVPLKRL